METVRFIARAEARPGVGIEHVTILALVPGHEGIVGKTCPGTNECEFSIPVGDRPGVGIYGAIVKDAAGETASSASYYVFQVGTPPEEKVYPLRVAFDFFTGRAAFKVLLVRDASYATDVSALSAAERCIYDGLLEDPAYRWRDNQLGFYYTVYPGMTSDYYSGLQSRCGQEPWLGSPFEGPAEDAAADSDIVGVLHKKDGFRDCAGLGTVSAGASVKRRFSADGCKPQVFHHEFGHALAGLSDEYRESTESRRSHVPSGDPLPPMCRCCVGDTTPGGP